MSKLINVALSLFSCSLIFPVSAKAITLDFTPRIQTTELGDIAEVDLVVSGLSDNTSPALGSFDITVGFNESVLDFNNVSFSDKLNPSSLDFGIAESTFTPPNSLQLVEVSGELPEDLVESQPGSFTLATIALDAIGVGTSDLIISDADLGDEEANLLVAETLQSGAITVQPRTVNTVPESSNSLALLVFGMSGLFLFSRRLNRE
jgi:hypothetical protein